MNRVSQYGPVTGCIILMCLILIASGSPARSEKGMFIPVEGTSGLHDEGGYTVGDGRVKDGLFFRSGDLSKIPLAGVDALKDMGIATVVDMRANSGESSRMEDIFGDGIAVVRLPMIADPLRDKNDYYKRMIVNSRDSLIGLIVLLSDKKNLPLIIFDEDGVDQVEVAAMFVLLTVGVGNQDVVSDYLLSYGGGKDLKREWGEIIVRYFDEYGGMEYYNTKILGLSGDLIDRLTENLIER